MEKNSILPPGSIKRNKPSRRAVYERQLRSPMWKRLRDKVLSRDEHKCTKCGATNVAFNVHHSYYYKGNYAVWEYPLEALVTLCNPCHTGIHDKLKKKNKYVPIKTHPSEQQKKKKKVVQKKKQLSAKLRRRLKEAKNKRFTGRGKSCLAHQQEERMRLYQKQGSIPSPLC